MGTDCWRGAKDLGPWRFLGESSGASCWVDPTQIGRVGKPAQSLSRRECEALGGPPIIQRPWVEGCYTS